MGIDVYNEECRKIVMRYALHQSIPCIANPAQRLSGPDWIDLAQSQPWLACFHLSAGWLTLLPGPVGHHYPLCC